MVVVVGVTMIVVSGRTLVVVLIVSVVVVSGATVNACVSVVAVS